MRKFYSFVLPLLVGSFFSTSLHAQYSNGLIVTNEGNIGVSSADVSYIENNTITNNVYRTANNGEILGDVLQSLYFYDAKGFLVVNNSNKITIVNRSSFVKEVEITEEIDQPRYTTIAEGKLFTTNTGYGQPSYVSVHDASSYQWITNITMPQSSEEIYTVGGSVYVMGAWYGEGNQLVVINPTTSTIETTLTLENGLQGLRVKGNEVFALTSNSTGTTLYKIDALTHTIVSQIKNTSLTNVTKFDLSENTIYLASGLNVYQVDQDLNTFGTTEIFRGQGTDSWGSGFYGFNVIDDYIYQINANEYVSPSTVYQYSLTGELTHQLTAGMIGNHIYKNVYENLSIQDILPTSKIKIYPNPTSDQLYIETSNPTGITYQILDYNGRLIGQGKYNDFINVRMLPKGTYMLRLAYQNHSSNHPFIVK